MWLTVRRAGIYGPARRGSAPSAVAGGRRCAAAGLTFSRGEHTHHPGGLVIASIQLSPKPSSVVTPMLRKIFARKETPSDVRPTPSRRENSLAKGFPRVDPPSVNRCSGPREQPPTRPAYPDPTSIRLAYPHSNRICPSYLHHRPL